MSWWRSNSPWTSAEVSRIEKRLESIDKRLGTTVVAPPTLSASDYESIVAVKAVVTGLAVVLCAALLTGIRLPARDYETRRRESGGRGRCR